MSAIFDFIRGPLWTFMSTPRLPILFPVILASVVMIAMVAMALAMEKRGKRTRSAPAVILCALAGLFGLVTLTHPDDVGALRLSGVIIGAAAIAACVFALLRKQQYRPLMVFGLVSVMITTLESTKLYPFDSATTGLLNAVINVMWLAMAFFLIWGAKALWDKESERATQDMLGWDGKTPDPADRDGL